VVRGADSAGATSSGEDQLAARLLFLAEAPPEVARAVLGTWHEALWMRAKQLGDARETALLTRRRAEPSTRSPICSPGGCGTLRPTSS
jgi:hypothetical protein